MKRIKLILFSMVLFVTGLLGQSPHGDKFKLDCSLCHSINNWNVNPDSVEFDHADTGFELAGQHSTVNCKSCHSTLVFDQALQECSSCHKDIHEQSVGLDCARCHSTTSWLVNNIIGIHRDSRFPLLGKHEIAECSQCHQTASNLRFDPLSIECYSCHSQDYMNTKNPDHSASGFSTNCEDCHEVSSYEWTFTAFAHDFFPLVEGHHIPNCYKCHSTTTYKGLSPDCYGCHQSDYESTANPSHSTLGFSTDCNSCHTLSPNWSPANFREHDNVSFPIYSGAHRGEWKNCSTCHTQQNNYSVFTCTDCHEHNQSRMNGEHGGVNGYAYQSTACYSCHPRGSENAAFDHARTNFPLIGAHTEPACSDCHKNNTTPSVECIGCHETNYNNTKEPNHAAVGIEKTCDDCHDSYAWTPSSFKHASTGFELIGKHSTLACVDCHSTNSGKLSQDCYECHSDSYATAPNHIAQNYPQDCTLCHNSNDWAETSFDHSATNFPLLGVHSSTDCASCHESGFTGTTQICSECHNSAYDQTTNPNHAAIGLELTCENCHDSNGWKPSFFSHTSTGFELLGKHSTLLCQDCHTSSAPLTSECYDCHSENYNNAPEHLSQNYPKDCTMCHNSNLWTETNFDHSSTDFPLLGVHASTDCASCHENGFTGTSQICSDCHKSAFDQTTNPNHSAIGLELTCENCHDSNAWSPSLFDHSSTGFELLGKHSTLLCQDCHTSAAPLASECYDCHSENYNNAPEHLSQNYPKDCVMCHNSNSWTETNFDHSSTDFPLLGVHATTDCSSCHETGFTGTTQICSDCHQSSYDQSVNPNHAEIGLALTCENCHNSVAWSPSLFKHETTGFTLTGQHNSIACNSCHTSATTTPASDCYSCHTDNYINAPEHLAQSYPKDCSLCHNTNNWEDTDFDHATTQFPLTGAHTSVVCADCHTNGYVGISLECNSCHNSDYTNATDPNHVNLGLAVTCQDCHTTNPGWSPATFPVHDNFYVLQGAHASIRNNCTDCHTSGYSNTPNTCYGCHESDYNNTNDPNHSASGFSTNCTECHSQSAWEPATFDHDNQFFPIYSGEHRGEWNACSDCHEVQSDFSVFTCISCHEHNRNEMDDEHRGVNGYSYVSTACYDCHPNGREGGGLQAIQTHENAMFKLFGAHQDLECVECHTNLSNPSLVKCIKCHEHNHAKNFQIHTGVKGFINKDFACVDCHQTGQAIKPMEQ